MSAQGVVGPVERSHIIFKERGIELPSNLSSVGYIEFEPDKLEDRGIELFRELVSLKIMSISVC